LSSYFLLLFPDDNDVKEQNIIMDTTLDHLVTTDTQPGLIVSRGIPLSSVISETTSNEESILDLSQRAISNRSNRIFDNWTNDLICNSNDVINDEDLNRISRINEDKKLNLEQSLTDQLNNILIKEDSMSDNYNRNQSKMDFYCSKNKSM
jgi:hypothetical protein